VPTTDRVLGIDEVVARIRPGMTIGIGGWGSRRKPMALVRAIARSGLTDLTVVSFGGPDVGLLIAGGAVSKVVAGFVTLDSIPLEPHYRRARQAGQIELTEYDEGMMAAGLYAATQRLPFTPVRAGLRSDVQTLTPDLKTIRSPYPDGRELGKELGDGLGEELIAMPALRLDVALVHMNAQYLGPDPYFDDLFCLAADQAFVSTEKVVPTAELLDAGPPQSLLINRAMVAGVVEIPGGAHFTSCVPDYERDEAFQAEYARAAADPESWAKSAARFLALPGSSPACRCEGCAIGISMTWWSRWRRDPT
jgi:acyl CoA:acetate/3-ketoacid CoA transferase alpha subunit